MKKIIWAVVIIVLVILGFYLYKGSSSSTPSTSSTTVTTTTTTTAAPAQTTFIPATQTDPDLLLRLKNASVSVSEDGTSENLVNGSTTFSQPGSSAQATVALYSSPTVSAVNAVKDFNGRKDVLVVLSVAVGQKNSQYLVLFADSGTSLTQKSIAYLGDSLAVQSLTLTDLGTSSGEDYVATVMSSDSSNKSLTSIIPVKSGAFDTAHSMSI